MSFVVAAPEQVQTAAQSLAGIRSTLAKASASATAPTTGVAVAAQDEVSAAVAALFNDFGQEYQVLNAQAQGFHAQFVNLMNAGAGAYLSTDVANAQQNLLNAVNAPAQSGGAAANAGGGVVRALTAGLTTAQSSVFPLLGGGGTLGGPLLGGLGGGGTSVGSVLGGLGVGGTPVVPLLGGLGGGGVSVSPLLGGLGGLPSVAPLLGGLGGTSLLGGLGGGSVGQGIHGVVSALENGGVGSLLSGPLGTRLPGLHGLLQPAAGTSGGPYQMLLQNTVANLQTFTSSISANPNPFLHQVFKNLMGYGDTISSQLAYTIGNFPALLASAPASIQAGIAGLLAWNPAFYVQQFITNQMIYGELAYSSLQSAGGYFTAGLQALPPHLQAAFQYTLAGNYTAAQGQLFEGALGLLVAPPGAEVTGESTSFTVTFHHYSLFPFNNGNLPTSVIANVDAGIVPVGTLGSLFPLFTIPGMEAQDFTNLLPGGSILQQMSQNFTNAVKAMGDTSIALGGVLDLTADWGPGSLFPSIIPPDITGTLGLDTHLGLPLALLLDAAGGPVNVWDAFNASADAFNNAALSGHYQQAASALIAAPANINNAFLNGHDVLPLSTELDGIPVTLDFPMDGILVGPTPASLTVDGLLTIPIGGTPLSGFAYGVYYASQQLANAITP